MAKRHSKPAKTVSTPPLVTTSHVAHGRALKRGGRVAAYRSPRSPFGKYTGPNRDPLEKGACLKSSFNRQFAVGDLLWYYRDLSVRSPPVPVRLKTAAFVAESGHVVCFVEGVRGFVSIDHLRRRT